MEFNRQESEEKLKIHRRKIQRFHEQINKKIKNNLDESLVDFIERYDMEINDEIIHYLRKYNEFLKGENK